MTAVDFGRRQWVLRSPGGALSVRLDVRSIVVCAGLAAVVVAMSLLSIWQGEYAVPPAGVVDVILGGGSRAERLVVLEWRLPRTSMAVLAGAALGASGAVFQSLTRNPLGSPDVIGFATGAYAGAVVTILVLPGQGIGTAAGALLGGIGTALVVYLLAYRRGVQGFRLIIVGIAVTAALGSITQWLMIRAELERAMAAAVWGTGSLNGIGWTQVGYVLAVVGVLVPAIAMAARTLRPLGLGDDAAGALGVNVRWAALWLAVLGVALTAVVTAYCGLIGFVALAAPQIARRLIGTAGVTLGASAVMGAALLTAADWVAQHGLGDREVPVGVVTVSIGGGYLLWLLVQEARRQ